MLRLLMPATWLAAALISLFLSRARRVALPIQLVSYAVSGFTTRLALDHHESRYQIAGFACAATIMELTRARRDRIEERPSWLFLGAAVAGAALAIVIARRIAHRDLFGL